MTAFGVFNSKPPVDTVPPDLMCIDVIEDNRLNQLIKMNLSETRPRF